MTLRDFVELVKAAGYKVFRGQYCVDISNGHTPCASVSLCNYAEGWVNTHSIDDEIKRAQLISLVADFANTPLGNRYEKVVAKHKNGSYVKEVTKIMMGEPAIRVEMTNDINEANDSISACERNWLNNFFGDKISYIEEY
nr:MAG TPA: hypothetical protein [Caudoviricetes sp.]